LPVYSILIPLRSEAAMVPQLFESMLALDYPALCIKRTKLLARAGYDSRENRTWARLRK
jgi:cellulose synthase/poly-beta-1,6-N-acetylglucosamine synthase-like glycosyltransferase